MKIDSPMWYKDWVHDYLVTFGRLADTGLAEAMLRWFPAFERMGVTEDDLQEITIEILTGAEPFPTFADKTLERITGELRRIRSAKNQTKEKSKLQSSISAKTDWSGWFEAKKKYENRLLSNSIS